MRVSVILIAFRQGITPTDKARDGVRLGDEGVRSNNGSEEERRSADESRAEQRESALSEVN